MRSTPRDPPVSRRVPRLPYLCRAASSLLRPGASRFRTARSERERERPRRSERALIVGGEGRCAPLRGWRSEGADVVDVDVAVVVAGVGEPEPVVHAVVEIVVAAVAFTGPEVCVVA